MLKVFVTGHLGKDCDVKVIEGGKRVINFTVAHSEKYKDRSGTSTERTTWLECAYWNDNSRITDYLKKGTLVLVEGQPEARAYEKRDGTLGASLVVRVSKIELLGGKPASGGQGQSTGADAGFNSPYNQPSSISEPDEISDLPF